jgi:hypothetical protein
MFLGSRLAAIPHGVVAVAQHATADTPDEATMAAHEQGERRLLAAGDERPQQLGVRRPAFRGVDDPTDMSEDGVGVSAAHVARSRLLSTGVVSRGGGAVGKMPPPAHPLVPPAAAWPESLLS